ncbi:hypothetical protein GI075_12150 [Salmonella enterica]|uniref:Uncharacterized protein n=4 Tax=Salmonella enterica TaxID=28901 RepID=A0A742IFQ8_SALMU|nr:hypothetical protein [Salmonella enterica]EDN4631570.1 hypothetical protein [Salmonella enterica subsp. enterica serovar Virginia]EDQ9738989.1 hypothetical protein [Salmonella enterica subsp. enterica serovar Oranienburg]EDU5727883.1 hypothetical protein [Salmonella enterica subsp. enterica serovar Typhimurium var. 5-]EDW0104741.1 hypothetical protein [Salmonella enterica subsp. salamae serovar 6,7:z:1,5]EDW5319123.1 hypothetical protein [Salmonella enterica subsp. enterica serovar Manhatta
MPLRTIRVVEMAGAIGKVRYIRAVINDNIERVARWAPGLQHSDWSRVSD